MVSVLPAVQHSTAMRPSPIHVRDAHTFAVRAYHADRDVTLSKEARHLLLLLCLFALQLISRGCREMGGRFLSLHQ